jgi:membrane-bound metal-dependent hydrolase YbcI (DUF457 family)
MLVGHFAVGLVAKPVEPKISLGTLVLASLAADLLAWIFILAGIEHVCIKPGITATNALDLYDIPLSHSLLMDAIWGAVLAAAYFLRRRYRRGAWVLFVAVLSHWLLDFVSHRPDMPLAPGVHRYFGLGLYNSFRAIFIVEGLLWLLGVILYARATRPKKRAGVYAFWGVIALLTLLWMGSLSGAPPPNPHAAPIVSLIFFSLVVAWAYWMNRLRPAQA